MSFSLIRLPKKATLIALHGLLAGTSCTLILLTEERRRRINLARCAIRNAERIRSSKQYHAALPVLHDRPSHALNDIENGVSGEGKDDTDTRTDLPIAPTQPDQHVSTSAVSMPVQSREDARLAPDQQSTVLNAQAHGRATSTPVRPLPRPWNSQASMSYRQPDPSIFKRPVLIKSTPRNPMARAEQVALSEARDINVHENIRRMTEAALGLEDAVNVLGKTIRKKRVTEDEKSALVQAAASLCSRCQEAGLMIHAARALYHLVSLGAVTEADYYSSKPEFVIDHAISAVEAELKVFRDDDGHMKKRERTLARNKLDRAIKLLLPIFTEKTLPLSRVQEWVRAAERSMDLAFDLDMVIQAANVYWRVHHYNADPKGLITRRFLERISERGSHNRVVNTFHLVRYRLAHYAPETWYAIGDLAATSAENAHGQDPARLLKDMLEFCPAAACSPQQPLRTTWVTKLLFCHWQRTRDFEQSLILFRQFEELGGFDKVVHVDGPYRVMIQIAVHAEQWQHADEFLQKIQAVKPSTSKEARILGLVALAKGKLGDWNGVWEEFKRMEIKYRVEDVFAPVLHEFIKTHTTTEIEDFLKVYIQDLDMPLGSYMVNMVANRYGDVRDVQSFADWLAYCCSKGFQIDAAYGNAILTNCRRRWDFGLRELKVIYRTLRALSPSFVDGVTETDMITSVLRTHRRAKPVFIKQATDFVEPRVYRSMGSGDVEDVRLNMRHAFVTRNYRYVLFLYKSACKRHLPVDDGHLRIAVKSSLKTERRIQQALVLIMEGRKKGLDVSKCITPVFLSQIRRVFHGDTSDKDSLLSQIQAIITRFETNNLSLGHQDLLRVAHLLLQAKHYSGAISFGLSALQLKGNKYPDDIPTFQLLIQAYAYKGDVQGMKWTLAAAVHTPYHHKTSVFTALKNAKKLLMRQIQTSDVKKALWVVEEGLDRARLVRMKLAEDRKGLEHAALDIMKHAALEAGQPQDDGAFRRQTEMIAEMEERARREDEHEQMKVALRKADMEARQRAADELERASLGAADAMEKLLLKGKHEISTEF